ncbi:DUF4253 domain-containing protein [Streptomyces sp. NPDC001286]
MDAASLPPALPPGRIVESYGRSGRLVWMSDRKLPDADVWWRRLYADRAGTGLYPVLLEYTQDTYEFAAGGEAPVDAAAYFRDAWEPRSWPSFPAWPGLAAPAGTGAEPAGTGAEPDACAAEAAAAVVREDRARCLALVQAERGADVPIALNWPGMGNHMGKDELSGVLRSWEDRFGARLVGLGHGDVYLSAAIPPKDLQEAHVLAGEH